MCDLLAVRKTGQSPDELIFNPRHKHFVVLLLARRIEHKETRTTFSSIHCHCSILRNAADCQRIRLGKGGERDKKKDEE